MPKTVDIESLYKQFDNCATLRKELEHIQKPYTVNQIIDQYVRGDYNAELLLQHCLHHILNQLVVLKATEKI
jgi:hypothetical protein